MSVKSSSSFEVVLDLSALAFEAVFDAVFEAAFVFVVLAAFAGFALFAGAPQPIKPSVRAKMLNVIIIFCFHFFCVSCP